MKLGRRRFGLLAVLAGLAGRRAFSAPVSADRATVLAAVAQSLFPHDEVSMQHYQEIAAAFFTGQRVAGAKPWPPRWAMTVFYISLQANALTRFASWRPVQNFLPFAFMS